MQEGRETRFDAGQYSCRLFRWRAIFCVGLRTIKAGACRPLHVSPMGNDMRTTERLLAQAELCEKLASQSWSELEAADLRRLASECREAARAASSPRNGA